MTTFNDAIDSAAAAAEDLAIDLLNEALRRCRREALDDCDDWHGVLNLVDDAASQIYGDGVDQRICRLLTEAGIDLPIDPQTHGFCEDHILVEAILAACDVLAKVRLDEMPTSVEEALGLATARVRYLRRRLGPSGAGPTSPASAAAIDDWLRRHFYCPYELEQLMHLGMVVVREGRPVLPSTAEERSEARHALQDYLVSDVRERLGSYCDPCEGRIEVRDVTLTAEEEAAVRAAAREIDSATA